MAAESRELEQFVKEALTAGQNKPAIAEALKKAGWTEAQTRSALATYADAAFPIPVPRPRASLSARDAFLYLVMVTALLFSAFNLGSLLFDFIDRAFPDPAAHNHYRSFYDSIRWSVSSLTVAFPLFLFLASYTSKEMANNPIKRLSGVRRWIIYLTLFLASAILIGDATSLIYHLLGGELTLRFLLKTLVVAVITGSIFGYYLCDLRRDEKGA